MRKILFIVMVAGLGTALGPATALADHGHGRDNVRMRAHDDMRRMPPSIMGRNAATVASFSNGLLTVTLGDGSTVRGRVTNATELECHALDNRGMRLEDRHDGRGDGGGDRNDRGGGDGHEFACTTRALKAGTVIDEAELQISHGVAFWERIELIVKRSNDSRS